MFNTVSVKERWREVFSCGNAASKDVILLMGSCRVVPILNYLNIACGNTHNIFCIDPINYAIDEQGTALPQEHLLTALETDEHFLAILRSVTIFIHEGLSSFGILNTVRQRKNIYSFGMKPQIDVNLPNFHDVLLLVNDFIALDPKWRHALTEEDQEEIFRLGNDHIMRFLGICAKSSFPEFGEWFRQNYQKVRLFHSFNHVSSAFTLEIFRRMNEQFLHFPLDDAFWQHPDVTADMYGNNSTKLSRLDLKWRALDWGECVSD